MGLLWRVVEFLHVKPGKGSAFVSDKAGKMRRLGMLLRKPSGLGKTVPQANLEKRTMQHTYKEGDQFVFMDMETYEESRLSASKSAIRVKYLNDGMEVNVVTWGDQFWKWNCQTLCIGSHGYRYRCQRRYRNWGYETCIVSTGAQVMVPLFISIGERI
jgi:elongation factor P